MKAKHIAPAVGLALLAAGSVSSAMAVQVNFQGSLVESLPCTINNNELIEVEFGNNLIIRSLDGVRYSKPVPYAIECSAPGTVRLSLKGVATQFDSAAIATDATGLGIRLTRAGQPFTLNSSVAVDVQNPPVLMAVPVADPAQPPVPGAFTARATLLADYQ